MGNIASENIKPCNIGSCEAHNRRTAEYMRRINAKDIYVRQDLTAYNESWVSPELGDMGLQQYLNQIAKMVKEKTGRAMQMKERERKDKKTGKVKKVSGCSALREGVVVCKANVTMADLRRYTQLCHERWGITAIQIHIHRDEGHYEKSGDKSSWKPNYHAHIIWDWMSHETGKSFKLNKNDMSELQTLLAETLRMERGKRKEETGREHLDRNDYILATQRKLIESGKKVIADSKSQVQQARQDAAEAKSQLEEIEQAKGEKEAQSQELDSVIEEKRQEAAKASQDAATAQSKLEELESAKSEKEAQNQKLDEVIAEKKRKADEENVDGIMSGFANFLGKGKYAAIEKENAELKKAIPEQKKALQQQFNAAVEKEAEKKTQPYRESIQSLTKHNSDLENNYNALLRKYNAATKQNNTDKADMENERDWLRDLATGVIQMLYNAEEVFRKIIDAIIDFARSGFGGRGGKHGDIFYNEEAAVINDIMNTYSKEKEHRKYVGRWLVDFAASKGELSKQESARAYKEVDDVAEGRYDWRIRKGEQSLGL